MAWLSNFQPQAGDLGVRSPALATTEDTMADIIRLPIHLNAGQAAQFCADLSAAFQAGIEFGPRGQHILQIGQSIERAVKILKQEIGILDSSNGDNQAHIDKIKEITADFLQYIEQLLEIIRYNYQFF